MSDEVVTPPPVSGRRLTIGAVCAALRIDHPDISISKIRYLEEQGLLHPQRTRGGYRLFAQEDVERLRTILRLQRDEFLPLRVIREELEKAAEGARQRPRRRPVSTGAARGPRFGELISAAGVNEEFVRSLEEFGLIAAEAGRLPPRGRPDRRRCRAAAALRLRRAAPARDPLGDPARGGPRRAGAGAAAALVQPRSRRCRARAARRARRPVRRADRVAARARPAAAGRTPRRRTTRSEVPAT